MFEMTEEQRIAMTPLHERIMAFVDEQPFFQFRQIKELFPQESDKNIYRAIQRLEKESRIRFLRHDSRSKVYTSMGVSKLPTLKGAQGLFTVKELFNSIASIYANGHYPVAERLNSLPVNYCKLFLIAVIDDPRIKKAAFLELHRELIDQRSTMVNALENLDNLLKHATMAGDMDYFTSVFGGQEAPTPQEMNDFKRWYKKWSESNEESRSNSEGT